MCHLRHGAQDVDLPPRRARARRLPVAPAEQEEQDLHLVGGGPGAARPYPGSRNGRRRVGFREAGAGRVPMRLARNRTRGRVCTPGGRKVCMARDRGGRAWLYVAGEM